jgi:hypothetical protein
MKSRLPTSGRPLRRKPRRCAVTVEERAGPQCHHDIAVRRALSLFGWHTKKCIQNCGYIYNIGCSLQAKFLSRSRLYSYLYFFQKVPRTKKAFWISA